MITRHQQIRAKKTEEKKLKYRQIVSKDQNTNNDIYSALPLSYFRVDDAYSFYLY